MSRDPARAKWSTAGLVAALATVVALVSAACGGGGNATVTANPTGGGATTTAASGGGDSSSGGGGGDLAEGEKVYKANCAACHGATGKEGGVGPSMLTVKTVFPEEKDHVEWVKEKAAGTSGAYGANGSGNAGKGSTPGAMPKYADTLSDDDIANVVAYERSLAK